VSVHLDSLTLFVPSFYQANSVRPEIAPGTPLAWVAMPNLTYPAIQLVNSNHIKSVSCSQSTIKMEFKDQGACDFAWQNWHNEVRPDGDYVVVTSEPSCMGASANQERHFLRAKTEEKDNSTRTISCVVEPISIGDSTCSNISRFYRSWYCILEYICALVRG
jgi:hypothetical protein